jgi:hypothetical protein
MGVKLTTHLHLVPRSRKVELYLHSPICFHGIVLIKHRGDNFIIFISELTCQTYLETKEGDTKVLKAIDSQSFFREANPCAAVTVENGEGGHKRHAGPGLPAG